MNRRSGSRHQFVHSVTGAPRSLKEDQQQRMRRYLISMGIRTVCFVAAVFVGGPLRWVLVGAALILPYIAVVMANAAQSRRAFPMSPVTGPERERPQLPRGNHDEPAVTGGDDPVVTGEDGRP